jgi:hypothetical protein
MYTTAFRANLGTAAFLAQPIQSVPQLFQHAIVVEKHCIAVVDECRANQTPRKSQGGLGFDSGLKG